MKRTRKIGYPAVLLALLAVFFSDIIFSGRTLSTSALLPGATPTGPYGFGGYAPERPFSYDVGGSGWVNEPAPYLIEKLLREGGFPLWNPREGLGMPLTGDLNKEIFNPLKVLLNISPSPLHQDLYYLLRLFLMGLFAFLFLTERGLSGIASLTGAAFFMLCGYSIWLINLHPLATVMYIPLHFYLYERWERRGAGLSPLSLSIAFSIFGGKVPEVVMGLTLLFLYASYRGITRRGIRGMAAGAGRVLAAAAFGILLASVAVLPFLELYSRASPIARAIRTGAATHTLPLVTSVSLWQPLFLGWKDYLHGSWLQWQPKAMIFYSGITVLLLFFVVITSRRLLLQTLPFTVFSVLLFAQLYGLLPADLAAGLPVFGSMNFLKYNSMLYFSLAVISATAVDDLIRKEGGGFRLALPLTLVVLVLYFLFLSLRAPEDVGVYLREVLAVSLAGVLLLGLLYRLFGGRPIFGAVLLAAMGLELFLYMPKDHPERAFPYRAPPYMGVMEGESPYRMVGDAGAVPPLVSNALGLYDLRGIDVLIPGDYYIYFENLVSFSVPYTNGPDALLAAASPWTDLLGVRYILSREELAPERLGKALRFHVDSLRWIRLFREMVSHRVRGRLTYGFYSKDGERRFSLFFPLDFRYRVRARVTEPYIFVGLALRDAGSDTACTIAVTVGEMTREVSLRGGGEGWKDLWIDVSEYMGREVLITLEGSGSGGGDVALGNFGLSRGRDAEEGLYQRLLTLYEGELPFIRYRGEFGGLHLYENGNVMPRAFLLRDAEAVEGLAEVIARLQDGHDFRKTALTEEGVSLRLSGDGDEGVRIVRYGPERIRIDVRSGGGVLVLSDLYYPGWRVKVNGREKRIIKVFGLLRGVVLKPGRSEVLFYYQPWSFRGGVILSVLGALSLVIISLHGRRSRGYRKRTAVIDDLGEGCGR